MNKFILFLLASVLIVSCNNQDPKTAIPKNDTIETKDTISGLYKTEIDSLYTDKCEISVSISKSKNGYLYHLKTDLRDVKGNVRLISEAPNELYLVFEGIKWDAYEGDISNQTDDNDTITKDLEIPVGIEAYVGNDTLTIQNDGNAMNSYTKIGECGRKFIYLIKQNNR
jgi:hypothetical protein